MHGLHRGCALGEGAGFVEYDVGELTRQLQCLRVFHQNALFGAFADANGEGGGCGKSECTRTGDDEYIDECGEGEGGWTVEREEGPEQGRCDGEDDNGGHENTGYAIGELLYMRFGAEGLFHAGHDLR